MAKTKKSSIVPAKAGAPVMVSGRKINTVAEKCEHNRGQWYCMTCGELLDNQLQKTIHTQVGRHVLAWMCHEHGRMEVP